MAIDIIADRSKKIGYAPPTSGSRKPIDIIADLKLKRGAESQNRADIFRKENPIISGGADILNKGITRGAEYLANNPKLGGLVQGAAGIAQPVNEFIEGAGIPGLAAGALEGLTNTGISIGNLPLKGVGAAIGKEVRVPHVDFGQYLEGPQISYEAGKFLGPLMTGVGGIKKTQELARPGGYTGILSDILKGAGIGYATGETSEGERGLGATIGGIFGGLRGSSKKVIGKRIEKNKKEIQQEFSQGYDKLFKDSAESGVTSVKAPDLNFNRIIKSTPSKYHESLNNYKAYPSIENSHRAQSDLGKIISNFESTSKVGGLSDSQIRAWNEAVAAQSKIRNSMYKAFEAKNRPDLAEAYQNLTKGYAEEYIPYTSKETKSLLKKLLGNEKHEKFIGENYPEIGTNEGINRLLRTGGYLGAVGTAGYLGNRAYEKLLGK